MSERPIVMLGDSLTARGNWNALLPGFPIRNCGIDGDTCAGVWGRLDEVLALNPRAVFLQIGINDFLGDVEAHEIVAGHLRIWEELSDGLNEAALFVTSLFPYREAAFPYSLPLNGDIMAINRELEEKAGQWKLPFINLFPILADGDNQLRPEYSQDGLHLTPAAYKVWAAELLPLMTRA